MQPYLLLYLHVHLGPLASRQRQCLRCGAASLLARAPTLDSDCPSSPLSSVLSSMPNPQQAASPLWAKPAGCSAQNPAHSRRFTGASLWPVAVAWSGGWHLRPFFANCMQCAPEGILYLLELSFLIREMRMTPGPSCTLWSLTRHSQKAPASWLSSLTSARLSPRWTSHLYSHTRAGLLQNDHDIVAVAYYVWSTYCVLDSTQYSRHMISCSPHPPCLRDRSC